ncbi:MAG: carbon starvation protein A [Cyclonatronaceae bacterium]
MSVLAIIAGTIAILLSAYRFYGSFVARKLGIDNRNVTPAHTRKDGVDYVPSNRFVVLGHHFASIAGAGPIVGPVIAVSFGWIPALLWIIIGGIFVGAVHDITSMTASLRHQGKSIGEIIQQYIGDSGKKLFLIFAFATLVLVIAVFMDIVARTFVTVPAAASASVFFIVLALVFGVVINRMGLPLWISTVGGVGLLYFFVFLGELIPFQLGYAFWIGILIAYIFLAAVTPVSILLQPRDFLNSFLLYGMILFGVIGVLIGNPRIEMTSGIRFQVDTLGFLFPVLFVTIACGAISGFHSLVASGTTSKQIDKEEDAKIIGFGGMLIETLLAVIAVMAVAVMTRGEFAARLVEVGPVTLFSEGLGGFIASIGIPVTVAISFVALTVSAFALTTLDTCTRLARFIIQEYAEDIPLAGVRSTLQNRFAATLVVVVLSGLLLLTGQFEQLWPIFGSANQLLAALALLAGTVWLAKMNVNPLFTVIPMIFMFSVTLLSLLIFAWNQFLQNAWFLSILSLSLFVLAVILVVMARNSLHRFYRDEAMGQKKSGIKPVSHP